MHWVRSLHFKFSILATLVVVTVVLVVTVAIAVGIGTYKHQEINQSDQALAELSTKPIVETYLSLNQALGLELPRAIGRLAHNMPDVSYFQIIDLKGAVIYDSRTLKRSVRLETVTDPTILQAIKGSKSTSLLNRTDPQIITPYFAPNDGHTYSVRYFVSYSTVRSYLGRVITMAILLGIVGATITFGIFFWVAQQWIIKPIDEIRADTNVIAAGDLDQRVKTPVRTEVGLVAQNINNIVETLGKTIKALEEEQAWKNEFIVLASHNLRSPMSVIMSAASSLKKDPKLSPENTKLVDYIYSRGKELHTLIENLLSISMLKGNRPKVAHEPFDILVVANTIAKDHEAHLKEKNIVFKLECKADHVIVTGDEGQIFQVLDNLINNAIKFTPANGAITVSMVPTAQDVTVTVKDTGEGIREDVLKKLFQSFRRGSEPFSVENRGAGIGLYYVKLAVEAHGGEVSIRSQEGKGTEVTFRIPRTAPSAAELMRQAEDRKESYGK